MSKRCYPYRTVELVRLFGARLQLANKNFNCWAIANFTEKQIFDASCIKSPEKIQ